jgi:photosystem II stability/assembly factor-like uncharacterized protein
MKKLLTILLIVCSFSYPLFGQTATVQTTRNYFICTIKISKIDSNFVSNKEVKLTSGYHTAKILLVFPSINTDYEYSVGFNLEDNKEYGLKFFNANYLKNNKMVFNDMMPKIVEKKSEISVTETKEPREFSSYESTDGTSYLYHSPDKPNLDSVATLTLNNPKHNSVNIHGDLANGESLYYYDLKETKTFYAKPGYYFIDFKIQDKKGSFHFKLCEKQSLSLNFTKDSAYCDQSFNALRSVKINNIFFLPDGIHAWIVGDDGIIFKSNDAGNNWKFYQFKLSRKGNFYDDGNSSHLSNSLRGVFFIDSLKGWAVGQKGTILNTRDGGRSWARQFSNEADEFFNDVIFKNEMEGFATPFYDNTATYSSNLKYTNNGGQSWSTIGKDKSKFTYYYVFDKNNIWKEHLNDISVSNDLGENWVPIIKKVSYGSSNIEQNFSHIFFIDSLSGWIIDGVLKHTIDGGKTWTQQKIDYSPTSIYFIDKDNGWVLNNKNRLILSTNDGGDHWTRLENSKNERCAYTKIFFINSNNGWAVDEMGYIYHTTDGGEKWTNKHILDFVNY